MSLHNKVIWSEGLFIRPQHFQQQERYFENLLEARYNDIRPYLWGVQSLKIDQEKLSLGKFALLECRAVLPDGTVVNIPEDVSPPLPIDIPENSHNEMIFLALPLKRHGAAEVVAKDEGTENLARYVTEGYDVGDNNANSQTRAEPITINIGQLRLRFLLESKKRGEYACLGIARVEKVRANNVVLDDNFIPPTLNCHAIPTLSRYITELLGVLRYQGDVLAPYISETGHGIAAIRDFLLLQTVNRFEPLFAHFSEISTLHPENFYREIVQMAGELATVASENKRPRQFPPYIHTDLQATFKPVMDDLRKFLSRVVESTVFVIPLQYEGPGHGVGHYVVPLTTSIGEINLRELLNQAQFVLAVNAPVGAELLQNEFSNQVKIGAVERIQHFIHLGLPGIKVRVIPAPHQIPFHKGFIYFELEQQGDDWQELSQSGGLAIHIGNQFQDIELELWAIKEQ